MLHDIALYLAAAVIFVPLFRRLGLGAVLGYLAGGIAIGPQGLGFISDVETILHVSEFGVVLLLFIIGLELQPSRLWTLRRAVFGMGGAQVLVTTLVLTAAGLAFGLNIGSALVAGFGLAMSSTALVLQMLAERKELATHQGRASFAVLLFQDLSVIPFLALLPMLAAGAAQEAGGNGWFGALRVIAVFAVVILSSRYLVRPAFRLIAGAQSPEVFTAAALLIVVATALAMEQIGLSASLGAFLAGVLLADSEYRHELQADIEPFKGLLLGLFFIAVGMSAQLGLIADQPLMVLGLVTGLLLIKGLILYVVGRFSKLSPDAARALAFALPQGGEFAFVLFAVAVEESVIPAELQALLVVVVTLSMVLTPLLYLLQARWQSAEPERPYDLINAPEKEVILAGFGPFGQIVGRVLRLKKISFNVLEKDFAQVDFVRQFGNQVFYGDASRIELLRAAQAGKARYFIIAVADQKTSLEIARTVRHNFPQLRIFACARTRSHALALMDLGVQDIIRRSYFSSLELSRALLLAMGETPQAAERAVTLFRQKDEETLKQQQAIAHDEKALIQSAQQSARELKQLFEADADKSAT